MARDPDSERTPDGAVVSPLCEVEAVAGVSPLGKARRESPVCGDSAQRPSHKKDTTPADTQPHAVTHSLTLSLSLSLTLSLSHSLTHSVAHYARSAARHVHCATCVSRTLVCSQLSEAVAHASVAQRCIPCPAPCPP